MPSSLAMVLFSPVNILSRLSKYEILQLHSSLSNLQLLAWKSLSNSCFVTDWKFLLSIPGVRSVEENTLSNKGLRASDLVDHDYYQFPRDFKTIQIEHILMEGDLMKTTIIQNRTNYLPKMILIIKTRSLSCGPVRWWRNLSDSQSLNLQSPHLTVYR